MLEIRRTDSADPEFQKLVAELDGILAVVNGEADDFFRQFNQIDHLAQIVVATVAGEAVGCGAIKPFSEKTMEVKRMFVRPERRGGGIAQAILAELEGWAAESGAEKCVLETSIELASAMRLYEKSGYLRIENWGQYAGVATSRCFEKSLF